MRFAVRKPSARRLLDRVALATALLLVPVSPAAAEPAGAAALAVIPAELTWHDYGSGASARRYLSYAPAGLPPDSPVVVWLHGCWFSGTDPTDDARVESALATGFPDLAAAKGFAVVFPQQPKSANSDECWNWYDPTQQWGAKGEAATIAGITGQVVDALHADPKKVYLAGHSAGGAMTAVVGSVYPNRYAALGISAGFPADTGLDALGMIAAGKMIDLGVSRMPVTVITGEKDPVALPLFQRLVVNEWRHANASARKRSLDLLPAVIDAIAPPAPASVDTFPAGGGEYARTVSHYRVGDRTTVDQWVFQGMGHEYPSKTMTPALWQFFSDNGPR
ncbi:alpha/beta hydrolase family esterase [Nocardia sp. NPDC060256]|uniref:extracellular catalytic domain type 1 short-chain-length polyhydroxyalkanoate depolymerase n=1 Tax=unclassified Nocardia TaxID=2637762 RepID=UPI003666D7A8